MTKQEAIQRLLDTEDPVELCEYATGFAIVCASKTELTPALYLKYFLQCLGLNSDLDLDIELEERVLN